MGQRVIAVVDQSGEPRDEVARVVAAVNQQISQDFAPSWWGLAGHLDVWPEEVGVPDPERDTRADAVLYLVPTPNLPDALGFHDLAKSGRPYGFVFTELARSLGEHWSTTLSHEALELLLDPEANLYAEGPHPLDRRRSVFHWREASDAVQSYTYFGEAGVALADFLLPAYFTRQLEPSRNTHFLGHTIAGKPDLPSFGIAPGGYVGYLDPKTGRTETVAADARGAEVMEKKGMYAFRRGSRRSLSAQET